MLAGMTRDERQGLGLQDATDYYYLTQVIDFLLNIHVHFIVDNLNIFSEAFIVNICNLLLLL